MNGNGMVSAWYRHGIGMGMDFSRHMQGMSTAGNPMETGFKLYHKRLDLTNKTKNQCMVRGGAKVTYQKRTPEMVGCSIPYKVKQKRDTHARTVLKFKALKFIHFDMCGPL